MSATPTIAELVLQEDDEFLLLGCDGLWECFENVDAVNFVRRDLFRSGNVQDAVTRLVKHALRKVRCLNLHFCCLRFADADATCTGWSLWFHPPSSPPPPLLCCA